MFEFLRHTKHFGWLAYVIEWLAPIAVALAFTFATLTTFQRSSDLQAEAHKAQVVACNAVRDSNAATIDFLNGRIAAGPATNRAVGQAFVRDLATAYAAADKRCRVKP